MPLTEPGAQLTRARLADRVARSWCRCQAVARAGAVAGPLLRSRQGNRHQADGADRRQGQGQGKIKPRQGLSNLIKRNAVLFRGRSRRQATARRCGYVQGKSNPVKVYQTSSNETRDLPRVSRPASRHNPARVPLVPRIFTALPFAARRFSPNIAYSRIVSLSRPAQIRATAHGGQCFALPFRRP